MSLWTVDDVVESAALKFHDRTALVHDQQGISFSAGQTGSSS